MHEKENYFKKTILTMTETEEGRDLLSIILGDYLSNRYGYCHFGFNYDTNGDNDGDPIRVFDIQWNVDTNGEVNPKLLKKLKLPKEVLINVHDLHLDDEYLEQKVLDSEEQYEQEVLKNEEQFEQQVLSDEELFIQEVLKLDDDVLQDILSAQEDEIQKVLSDENE